MPHRTKILHRDHLIQRIPEAFQESEDIAEYLRAAGRLFDDASDQIKLHDWYEDYRRTPEERLGLLLDKYGIDITKTLPEAIIRSIARDIHSIYTTNGTEKAFEWVFRLLGIGYKAENAWLIDPDLYFPDIAFEEDSPFDRPAEEEEKLKIGRIPADSYKIGEDNQYWLENTDFLIVGIPKIGYNTLIDESDISTGDEFLDSALSQRSFNYDEFDFKNFVYGEAVDQANGTYFYGRSFNSEDENVKELRIVGETYGEDAKRSSKFVMSTPYILLTISSEDFSRYINSYQTDDGDDYTLTTSDKARINEFLFEYLLMQVVKPSTVVILTIAQKVEVEEFVSMRTSFEFDFSDITVDLGRYSGDDDIVIVNDSLTMEREVAIPDAEPNATFICLNEAPICESHPIPIGEGYRIGEADQLYHEDPDFSSDGMIVIGSNKFCNSGTFYNYGSEITLTWDEQVGVDGYRIYKSPTIFDETSLPSPVAEVSGYTTTEYREFSNNDEQFYFGVAPFIAEGEKLSSLAYVNVQGCIEPFKSFTLTGSGVCMVPVEEFSLIDVSLTCPTELTSFSITSDVVTCDITEVTHPTAVGEGYAINGIGEESHLNAGFTKSTVIVIGDNTFTT